MLTAWLCLFCSVCPYCILGLDQWQLMRGMTFNADSERCTGQRYTFRCRYELGSINGSVQILKYPAEWNYDESYIADAMDMDYRPGLVPTHIPAEIREQAVEITNGTLTAISHAGSTVSEFTWELTQLTGGDSGVYCCLIRSDDPRIAATLRFSRLSVQPCWPTYLYTWIPLGLLGLLAAGCSCFFCVCMCCLKRATKPVIRRLIVVSHPDESVQSKSVASSSAFSSSTRDSGLGETSWPTRSSICSADEVSSDPVTQPLVRFETVYTDGSLAVRLRAALRRLSRRGSSGISEPDSACLVLPPEQVDSEMEKHEAVQGKTAQSNDCAKREALTGLNNRFANMYCLTPDRNYELPRENLFIGSFLGGGAFGVVYSGVAKDLPGRPSGSQSVAVKTLRENFTESDVVDILKEMDIMKQLHYNKHIIQLLAVCTQRGAPCLVLEYAPHGNLRDYLRAHKCVFERSDSTVALLLNYSRQVAEGMTYLSSRSIIHRDLAARNILVGNNYVLKISDFGLTRNVEYYYRKVTNGRLPIKWLAPESMFERIYTTKSDVWSFGVLLWEIFTFGSPPFHNVDPATIPSLIRSGGRNPKPKIAPDYVYSLMCACWTWDPKQRPAFAEVSHQLSRFERTVRARCDDDDDDVTIESNNLSPISLSTFWGSRQFSTAANPVEASTTDSAHQPYSDSDSGGGGGAGGGGDDDGACKSDVTQYLEVQPSRPSDNSRILTFKPACEITSTN